LKNFFGEGQKYQDYNNKNILKKLKPLLQTGGATLHSDGTVSFNVKYPIDGVWCHPKQDRTRKCFHYMQLLFDKCKMIAKRCFNCWKVVVRPRTVEELFKLLDLEIDYVRIYDKPCKCGIETRDFVEGLYGGYFYNDSLQEGKECYEIVRKMVSERISPDIVVALKRGCTEYELEFGILLNGHIIKIGRS
jgi:hypothetical protein